MNTATLVEETLRGLPASIEVVIPWSPDLETVAWWETSEELTYEFPTVYHDTTECEQFIARTTIDALEAVLEGNMSLPGTIDRIQYANIHRDGRVTFFADEVPPTIMRELVAERCATTRFNQETFNREFAHYYAGLVAQQRNKK